MGPFLAEPWQGDDLVYAKVHFRLCRWFHCLVSLRRRLPFWGRPTHSGRWPRGDRIGEVLSGCCGFFWRGQQLFLRECTEFKESLISCVCSCFSLPKTLSLYLHLCLFHLGVVLLEPHESVALEDVWSRHKMSSWLSLRL